MLAGPVGDVDIVVGLPDVGELVGMVGLVVDDPLGPVGLAVLGEPVSV